MLKGGVREDTGRSQSGRGCVLEALVQYSPRTLLAPKQVYTGLVYKGPGLVTDIQAGTESLQTIASVCSLSGFPSLRSHVLWGFAPDQFGKPLLAFGSCANQPAKE